MRLTIAKIKEEMERLGIDQSELARRSGIPISTLSRYLNNEVSEWRASNIAKIAMALQIPFWVLLRLSGLDIQPPGEEADDRIQDLIEAFPWLGELAGEIANLPTDDQQAVLSYVEFLKSRKSTL